MKKYIIPAILVFSLFLIGNSFAQQIPNTTLHIRGTISLIARNIVQIVAMDNSAVNFEVNDNTRISGRLRTGSRVLINYALKPGSTKHLRWRAVGIRVLRR